MVNYYISGAITCKGIFLPLAKQDLIIFLLAMWSEEYQIYMLTTITKEEETKTGSNNDNNDDIFHFFLKYQQAREQRRRGTFWAVCDEIT